jgi:hypothetical protein
MDDFIDLIQNRMISDPVQPQVGLVEMSFDDRDLRRVPRFDSEPVEQLLYPLTSRPMFSRAGDDPKGIPSLHQFGRDMAAEKARRPGKEEGIRFPFSLFFQNIPRYSNRSTP